MSIYNLDRLFQPRSVAVVGASDREGSVGAAVMRNLVGGGYRGGIHPINPNRRQVCGQPTFSSLSEISDPVDLVVIAVPIASVAAVIADCAKTGVGGAVIISAGGKETGARGSEVERTISAAAKGGGVRIVGPNCLGIVNSRLNLNASFAVQMPTSGGMAFISQSGAVCTAIMDMSVREKIGFSYIVSLGSMLDVGFGDTIDYLGNDPRVSSIVMYMESLTRHRNFMSAARAVARIKPIVVLKAGRTRTGTAAAASHTGAMAGEDAVYDAAFKRAGIVRVRTFEELFDCAEVLSKQPRMTGKGLAVVTNAGGAGVMAADALADYGLESVSLSADTLTKLDAVLPAHWSRSNPVDMLGDASVEKYRQVVDICTASPGINGLLIMLVPQAMIDPTEVAITLTERIKSAPFPVITSWIGGPHVDDGRSVFNSNGIPTLDTPERAIRAFSNLWNYSNNIELLQQIPSRLPRRIDFDRQRAHTLIRQGMDRKEKVLTEVESKSLLNTYGIPTNPTEPAFSAKEAARKASQIGYPVVLKIYSRTITHKTEFGGVILGLQDEEQVCKAYDQIVQRAMSHGTNGAAPGVTIQPMLPSPTAELILGVKQDRDFGPVILFGIGGIMTEVIQDRAIALPPLNRLLARRLMEGTKVFRLLKGYRNQPAANLEKLEEILIRLAQLVTDFAEIDELDINPLFTAGDSFTAVDARVILKQSVVKAPLHLVISPYPVEHESHVVTKGLNKIFIRPIRPEDAQMMADLFGSLTPRSIYMRFFAMMKQLPPGMLARFTQIDYDREIALVALPEDERREQLLGVARVIMERDLEKAEFSVLVGDPWQGKGIGAELLKNCLRIARQRGIKTIWGHVLVENTQMLALGKKLGFRIKKSSEPGAYELQIDLEKLNGI